MVIIRYINISVAVPVQQWFSIIWYPNQYSPAATGNSPDEDGAPPDDIIEEDDGISIRYTPTDEFIEEDDGVSIGHAAIDDIIIENQPPFMLV